MFTGLYEPVKEASIIQFNSIQFNSSLLMCQLYGQKANYRNSTTQMTTDNEQNTNETDKTKTNKQTNKQTKEYLNN
jgi:hypothetical protein